MDIVLSYIGRISELLGLVALTGIVWILSDLSRRLGEVTQIRNYWRLYYVTISTTIVFFVMRFTESGSKFLLYRVIALTFFTVGLGIASGVTARYWLWLWRKG